MSGLEIVKTGAKLAVMVWLGIFLLMIAVLFVVGVLSDPVGTVTGGG